MFKREIIDPRTKLDPKFESIILESQRTIKSKSAVTASPARENWQHQDCFVQLHLSATCLFRSSESYYTRAPHDLASYNPPKLRLNSSFSPQLVARHLMIASTIPSFITDHPIHKQHLAIPDSPSASSYPVLPHIQHLHSPLTKTLARPGGEPAKLLPMAYAMAGGHFDSGTSRRR
ncbi:hypothetical protein GQ600_5117 [Phytophthora cactorum]|nr:hypothetical protein GQ600_5117 [Phytophthora cactorum]